jgi:flagellar hook-associated protein 1 FlgK
MALSIGLDTAVKALRAHQLAVDVAAHNIANAHSPGFSRQRVLLRPVGIDGSDHWTRDAFLGRPGYGVDASEVRRVRDLFLDFQVRQTIGSRAQYAALANALGTAELAFDDPSDLGLSSALASFWNAWHDVVNEPESKAARTALVHSAETLASRIRRAWDDLDALRKDLNQQVTLATQDINAKAEEIARLNLQIKQVELNGDSANDLRDRRDLLLDELAEIAQISYAEQGDSTVVVYLGNHELVVGTEFRRVQAVPDAGNPGMAKLVFAADGEDLATASGRLRGLLDARDQALPDLIAKLDTLASALRTEVNALHQTGYGLDSSTGLDFFTGTGARDIAVNGTLLADPRKVAASASGAAGDAAIALQIANLQRSAVASLGNVSFDDFYASLVTVLGADTARAEGLAQSSERLVSHLEAMRQSVSGVNIDEEVTNLAASQRAYEAAARVITAIDEMLDVLINRTGITGR